MKLACLGGAWALLLMIALVPVCGAAPPAPVDTPEAAIAAARRTWEALDKKGGGHKEFGPAAIARFEPYTASKQGGVWTVRGTLPRAYHGVALVTTVRQADGGVQVQEVDINR